MKIVNIQNPYFCSEVHSSFIVICTCLTIDFAWFCLSKLSHKDCIWGKKLVMNTHRDYMASNQAPGSMAVAVGKRKSKKYNNLTFPLKFLLFMKLL